MREGDLEGVAAKVDIEVPLHPLEPETRQELGQRRNDRGARDLPDLPGLHELSGLLDDGVPAALETDDGLEVVRLGQLRELLRLGGVGTEWPLDVDLLLRLESREGELKVPVYLDAHDDEVNLWVVGERGRVSVGSGGGGELMEGNGALGGLDGGVGEGDDFVGRVGLERREDGEGCPGAGTWRVLVVSWPVFGKVEACTYPEPLPWPKDR
jgi:hypothetical protein